MWPLASFVLAWSLGQSPALPQHWSSSRSSYLQVSDDTQGWLLLRLLLLWSQVPAAGTCAVRSAEAQKAAEVGAGRGMVCGEMSE